MQPARMLYGRLTFLSSISDELPDIDAVPEPEVLLTETQHPQAGSHPNVFDEELEVDERQVILNEDPELEHLEDATYNWNSLLWNEPDAPVPVLLGNRGQLHPDEDISRVVGLSCCVCFDVLLYAHTLECHHMLCSNCAVDPRVVRCPMCQCPKKVKALSNVGSLVLQRVEDMPSIRIEREPVPSAPLPQPPSLTTTATASTSTTTATTSSSSTTVIPSSTRTPANSRSNRNQEAINDLLRQDGIDDPDAYRAELMRQGRQEEGFQRTRRRYLPQRQLVPNERQDEDEVGRHEEDAAEVGHQEEVEAEVGHHDEDEDDGHSKSAEDEDPFQNDGPRHGERETIRRMAAEAAGRRQEENATIPRAASMDEFDRLLADAEASQHEVYGRSSQQQVSAPRANDDGSDSDDSLFSYSQGTLRSGAVRRPLIDGEGPSRGRKRSRRQ